MSNEKEAPFVFSEIEDVKVLLVVRGKRYAVLPKKGISKEDAKNIRIALVSVLLEDHAVVFPSLEEIEEKFNNNEHKTY